MRSPGTPLASRVSSQWPAGSLPPQTRRSSIIASRSSSVSEGSSLQRSRLDCRNKSLANFRLEPGPPPLFGCGCLGSCRILSSVSARKVRKIWQLALKCSPPSSHASSYSGTPSSLSRLDCLTTLAGNHTLDSSSSASPLPCTVHGPEKRAKTRMPARISAGEGCRYARAASVESTHEAGSPSSHAIWKLLSSRMASTTPV
mmetsp:Transcript_26704/g.53638  ORF Transcript_26704/g.53638 Transcript_26704/m.53638 type:complete len:201 (-) Transcript_26704:709-1311(-)